MTAIRCYRFALIVLLFAPALARAELAAKPNAYTEKDRHRECLEFNLKTLVDTYKSIGNKNSTWDEQAIKFLQTAAQHFADVGFSDMYLEKSPTWPQLIELGEAAVKKGCDDPMVLYCYGAFLTESGRADDGKPVLQQAYKGLIQSKYPPERIYYSAKRLLEQTQSLKDRLEISSEMDKARISMVKSKFINAAHRRRIGVSLASEITEIPTKKQLDFYEQMVKDKETDKWIINLYGGRYFIKAAWAARGNGWANQVKPEGWQGFEASLERARECLMVAWKVAPNLPEAPAEMITVAMGQSNREGETVRTWFDRAIDAQFDYGDAFDKLRWALMPRWGGSHEEILALGIEAFRTGRYDTWVPYQLIRSLETIRSDRGGDMSLWDKPEIYEMVRDVMTNYAGKFKDKPDHAGWYLSYAAALANRQNKHDESRKFLEQIEGKPDERPYRELHLLPQGSISESYLMTSPFAKPFEAALELQKAGKHEQAAAVLQKMLDEMPKDDKGQIVVRGHLEQSQRFLKLASGEWIDLTPGIDLLPWGGPFGTWSSPKQGELMGVADRRGLMALSDLDMPPRYEFSAQMEIPRMGEIPNAHVGMVLNFTGWQAGYPGVWLYPGDKKLLIRGNDDKFIDVTCGSQFKLLVRVIDDEATVMLDDKEVAKFAGVGRANAKHLGIGFSGMFERPEGAVVFREMRVRKLKKEGDEK